MTMSRPQQFDCGTDSLLNSKRKESSRMKKCPPYCSCTFPDYFEITEHEGPISDLYSCRCGEDDPNTHEIQWQWYHDPNASVCIDGQNVTFHPTYSQGTTIIRGDTPLKVGMVHYWEIRLITASYGTDMMFGIGTDKVDLLKYRFHFISALGMNTQSWGLSYTGKFYHNGKQFKYMKPFSQGCLIGICVDLSRGTLEYFINRRPLGVICNTIPTDNKVVIYPMVSSTTARSAIRLVNASSRLDCLQMRAYQVLVKTQRGMLKEMKRAPGLNTLVNLYWFLDPPVRYSSRNPDEEYDLLDEAVIALKAPKKKCKADDSDDDEIIKHGKRMSIVRKTEGNWSKNPLCSLYCNNHFQDLSD